jgi:hypothetical protein
MILGLALPAISIAGTIQTEYKDYEEFTDFSVYGLSEEKTLRIFKTEIEPVLKEMGEKHLGENETMVMTFTDIDMAGDIQPWRNINNADIRYVEAVYPPRLKFTYAVTDADGEVVMEGEENISDLAYQMNSTAVIRNRYKHFFYETELLENWFRKTFRDREKASGS